MRVHHTKVIYATEPGAARVKTDVQRQVPMAAKRKQLLCRFSQSDPNCRTLAEVAQKAVCSF